MESKIKYHRGLEWQNRSAEFDRDHQVILLACSRIRWTWTSLDYILTRLHMENEKIHRALDSLLKCKAIIHAENDGRSYFALIERLEKES